MKLKIIDGVTSFFNTKVKTTASTASPITKKTTLNIQYDVFPLVHT